MRTTTSLIFLRSLLYGYSPYNAETSNEFKFNQRECELFMWAEVVFQHDAGQKYLIVENRGVSIANNQHSLGKI